jgi:high-affinity nickel-transport protein
MSLPVVAAGLLPALALACLLGFRHGFDADHIAVVDGMTRSRQLHHSYWTSRLVGAQFAIGHSAVILLASVLLFGQSMTLPNWLDGLGLVISTCFLLVIAASNFGHALRPPSDAARPIGPVSALLMRLTGRHLHPALVGMSFALSLDSLGQAAFFASRGAEFSGMTAVVAMACAFGTGMLVADAGNGALLNWFARRSDGLARQASRFSSGFIAVIALLTAGAGVLRQFEAGFARSWEGQGMLIGVAVVACTSIVYMARISVQQARMLASARHMPPPLVGPDTASTSRIVRPRHG